MKNKNKNDRRTKRGMLARNLVNTWNRNDFVSKERVKLYDKRDEKLAPWKLR